MEVFARLQLSTGAAQTLRVRIASSSYNALPSVEQFVVAVALADNKSASIAVREVVDLHAFWKRPAERTFCPQSIAAFVPALPSAINPTSYWHYVIVRLSNDTVDESHATFTVPVGPLRCLPMISSA
jgi:hypothetical protein